MPASFAVIGAFVTPRPNDTMQLLAMHKRCMWTVFLGACLAVSCSDPIQPAEESAELRILVPLDGLEIAPGRPATTELGTVIITAWREGTGDTVIVEHIHVPVAEGTLDIERTINVRRGGEVLLVEARGGDSGAFQMRYGPVAVHVPAVGSGSVTSVVMHLLPQDGSFRTVAAWPRALALFGGEVRELTALVRDSAGTPIPGASIEWTALDPSIASVSAGGVVTAGAVAGLSRIVAVDPGSAAADTVLVSVSDAAAAFVRIASGRSTTCALTAAGETYCWGAGIAQPTRLPSLPPMADIEAGYSMICGITASADAYCWREDASGGFTTPQIAPGGHEFIQVTINVPGCGLTAEGLMYCWSEPGAMPEQFATDLRFTAVGRGDPPVCGLVDDGRAYCWQIAFNDTEEPVLIDGDQRYTRIATSWTGTACGLDAEGEAFCWGSLDYGQIGAWPVSGCEWLHCSAPVRVAGGVRFTMINGGGSQFCGLDYAGRAHCWGSNGSGRLGTGGLIGPELCEGGYCALTPAAVASDEIFRDISTGSSHTCAITEDYRTYCWGNNREGALGAGFADPPFGTEAWIPYPVPVTGVRE